MHATLLVLAAGMGSRYGGLKQLDPMGPDGETLLDYSVFDARRAGFDKVVFVIRRDFESQFRRELGARFENRIAVDYVFQDLQDLPDGCRAPAERQKPWGRDMPSGARGGRSHTPFAAVNADDFYGRDAFRVLADFFHGETRPDGSGGGGERFAMVGYRLDRTLSEHGSVSRGLCKIDADDNLQSVEEITNIERVASGGARYTRGDGSMVSLSGNETVSLNFWGFNAAVFPMLEEGLARFLSRHAQEPKTEYYIPSAVSEMISGNRATVRVLPTEAVWFGVTYQEDRPLVTASLAELTRTGVYPTRFRDRDA